MSLKSKSQLDVGSTRALPSLRPKLVAPADEADC